MAGGPLACLLLGSSCVWFRLTDGLLFRSGGWGCLVSEWQVRSVGAEK